MRAIDIICRREPQMRAVVMTTLAVALAAAGTLAFNYPAGYSKGSFTLNRDHRVVSNGVVYKPPTDFSIAFGDTQATITWAGGTLAAGSQLVIELDAFGDESGDVNLEKYAPQPQRRAAVLPVVMALFGNPVVADRDGICAAQVRTGAGVLAINGAGVGVSGGAWTADQRRNVTLYSAADLSALTFTIKGKWNGVDITRTLAGPTAAATVGTTATFDSVTEVSVSATIGTNVEVGYGDVLGSPVRIASVGCVLKEFQDGIAPTAGTVVAGVNVTSATAGDPLGTYDPNAACDGAKTFHLAILATDPAEAGPPQFPATV